MLSLVADYDTTSSSSSTDDDVDNEASKKMQSTDFSSSFKKPSLPLLLPSANLLLSGGVSKPSGDVFSNQFLEAEKLEVDKFQKHVKMVESENHLVHKNGRKICWNNRKGRCRFGNKCKYAHDSDLVDAEQRSDVDKQIVNNAVGTPDNTKSLYSFEKHTTHTDETSDSSEKSKTRKRAGLGDSIVPGKRVMKTYQNSKKQML